MLVSITIANFLSFKEPTEFALFAGPIKEHLAENTIETSITGVRLLKGAAIYGPNSSGKSNLLKSLRFVTRFITDSAKESQTNEDIEVTNFKLSTTTENKPSFFEIKVIYENVLYRYGFEVDRKKVHKEWLFFTKKIKESRLFERTSNRYSIENKFIEGRGIETKTRKNTLFLSAVAQWNGEISTKIVNCVNNIIFLGDSPLSPMKTLELMNKSRYRKAIREFIQAADLGFTEFESQPLSINKDFFEKLPSEIKTTLMEQAFKDSIILTSHDKLDENNKVVGQVMLDMKNEESQGTKKFFALCGYVVEALFSGKVLIIDELTSRLHPELARFIITKFHSIDYNTAGAQLVFTSHNTYLMNKEWYRRDQIYFTGKTEYFSTKLTTLLEQNIRNDASFERRYFIEGFKFHGLPRINREDYRDTQLNLFSNPLTGDDND